MRYIGEFNDINEVTYRVEIITPTEGEDETLTMSGEPVIISYESEDEQAYKPYKCSTATISFYLNEANFDLIDAFANRVRVTIYKGNEVIWCGYATPNAYSQSYEDYRDVFELECQDGISTLQYYDYEYIPLYEEYYYNRPTEEHPYNYNNNFPRWAEAITEQNKATNLFHLIMQMNKKLGGMYDNIYVTDSIINPYTRNISILDSTFISEHNFFDEDGKPMKMLEVLEEICRYCSLTCVPYGRNLYFLSLDAVAAGNNGYFHYTRLADDKYVANKVNLVSNIDIDIDSFNSKGCKITTDSVYNYSEVKDDLYSIDTLTPPIDDAAFWIYTDKYDGETMPSETDNTTAYVEFDRNKNNFGEIQIKNERNDKQWVFLRYHGYNWVKNLNNRYVFFYYAKDTQPYHVVNNNNIEIYDSNNPNYRNFTWQNTYDLNGACIVEYATQKVDNWDDIIRPQNFETAIMIHTTSIADKDINYSTNPVTTADWAHGAVQPMFKVLLEPQQMKKGDYIVISGEMAQYHTWDKVPIDEGIDIDISPYWCDMWCSLTCGAYYWDGSQWILPTTTEIPKFKLPFDCKSGDKAFNNFIPIKNNISYRMRLDAEGYCIPCLNRIYQNEEGEINTIEFTFYRPHAFTSEKSVRTSLIKNFEIKIVGQKDNIINDDIENTKIESERPTDSNVSEYDDTTCKICTWDNKGFNWSQTFYIKYYKVENSRHFYQGGLSFIDDDTEVDIGGDISYPTTITSLLSNTIAIPSLVFKSVDILYDANKGYVLTPEELIISHNVEQYDNPTLNIEVNLKNSLDIKPYSRFTYNSQFPNFIFAVDKVEYNLRENEAQVKLINKKIEYEE